MIIILELLAVIIVIIQIMKLMLILVIAILVLNMMQLIRRSNDEANNGRTNSRNVHSRPLLRSNLRACLREMGGAPRNPAPT